MAMTVIISVALAKFCLLVFTPELKAQINNMIIPTTGMDVMIRVMSQSLTDVGGA